MSHVARIPTVGTGAPSARKPGVATLVLVISLLVAIAAAVALVATGPGASTENTVASDGPATHPRGLPLVRPAPTPGSVQVVPERDLDSRAQTSPGLAAKDEAATAAAIGNSGPLASSSGKDEAATAAAIGNSGPLASSSGKDEAATAAAIGAGNRK
jgi:hypothetical protein